MAETSKRLPIAPIKQRQLYGASKAAKHFAAGLNFYKLFWVFTIGSIIGCAVETIFVLITRGGYECRASLIYGPFNLIYGIGALVLYLGLYKINRKKKLHVFIFGAISGTVVEFVCSWVQEMVFGSISWDYSNLPLNVGGRVCILFAAFWGLLALAWVMFLQPAFDKLISLIPNSVGRIVTWALCAFLLFNIAASAASVMRWNMRVEGFPATTRLSILLDRFFPDSLMQHNFSDLMLPG